VTGSEQWFFVAAIIFLVLSACFALQAYQPVQHIVPLTEEVALQAVDDRPDEQAALAGFSLTLAAATEGESELNTERSGYIRAGVVSALIAGLFFILALSWEVFQKTSLPSPVQGGQSVKVSQVREGKQEAEGCASVVLVRQPFCSPLARGNWSPRADKLIHITVFVQKQADFGRGSIPMLC